MAAGARAMPGRRQRGFAMIALIVLMALMSSWFIATGLNRTNAELSNERERLTMESLRKAKAALIAYAASEQWQLYRSEEFKQPGALPCPDRNNDGAGDGLCQNALARVGRLPWKTLGIDELRDASGEKLWYAVSANFRKYAYPVSGYTVINSDTRGQLTVKNPAPANNVVASNVVAIVFAPGAVLVGQDRNPSDTVAYNNPASYLEGFSASYDTFTTSTLAMDTFNDRLVVITEQDLMAAVEPVVAALIERDVKPFLSTYFAEWGAYPFPARFDNPDPGTLGTGTTRAQSAYVGDSSQSAGLLPVTASATYTWVNGSGSSSQGNVSVVCATTGTSWRCTFSAPGGSPINTGATFGVEAQLQNPGMSFAKRPAASSVSVSIDGSAITLSSIVMTGSVSSEGTLGTITYSGTYTGGQCNSCSLEISIPGVTASALTSKLSLEN